MNLTFGNLSDVELVEAARQLAIQWKQRFKRKLGITSELAELYACQALGLMRMPSENQGYDAVDQQKKRYQIKGRAPDRGDVVNPQGTLGRFVNFDFDYALLVLIDCSLQCREIWLANAEAVKMEQARVRNERVGIRIFKFQEIGEKLPAYPERVKDLKKSAITKRPLFGGKRSAVPIHDTATGVMYKSMYACGRALAESVGKGEEDHFTYFKMTKRFPNRFKEIRD
jgi:hypothetical protein